MFDLIPFGALSARPDPVVSFVECHLDGLGHAAALLGGRAGAELVRDIAERLSRPGERSRGTERQLDRLEALLSLESVHCEESVEEAAFASIDPMNPFIEEVCLLVDGLRDTRSRSAESVRFGQRSRHREQTASFAGLADEVHSKRGRTGALS